MLGKVERDGARLIAQGFAQRPGMDYNETFAPVAKMCIIRLLIAFAAARHYAFEQLNFDTAFLNGKMTEDVYIKFPTGYTGKVGQGDVLKLIAPMYEAQQAPWEWNRGVAKFMIDQGYTVSGSDTRLYYKNVQQSFVIVALYVDDGLDCVG